MIEWIIDNKEWIFSGIGVLVISTIIGIILKKKNTSIMKQKGGKNSVNIQSTGNVTFNEAKKDE